MTTKTRPVRLSRKEAQAWMEAHTETFRAPACLLSQRPAVETEVVKGWRPGASEIRTCKVTGKLEHETFGDGTEHLPWRFQGEVQYDKEGKARIKTERHLHTFKDRKAFDRCLKARARREAQKAAAQQGRKPARDSGMVDPIRWERVYGQQPFAGLVTELTREERNLAAGARRQALAEMQAGGLKDLTVLCGADVPRCLWFDGKRGSHDARRNVGVVVHLADAVAGCGDYTPEEMVPDTYEAEQRAYAELKEDLLFHITAKELEALELRAAGVALPDRNARYALERAQRKARPVVAGKVIIRCGFCNTDASNFGPAAWDTCTGRWSAPRLTREWALPLARV